MQQLEPKIFCIGFNKTGTRTLIEALEILDLGPVAKPQALHDALQPGAWQDLVAEPRIKGTLRDDLHGPSHPQTAPFGTFPYRTLCDEVFDAGNYALALEIAGRFRSFKDRPWNVAPMYRELDRAFPGSRFLFTWRDPAKWWRSVEKWLAREDDGYEAKILRYLKHLKADAIERDQFLEGYRAYNDEVRAYFTGRSDFLELNWEEGHGWSELCGFLGVPVPDGPFPHANRQDHAA